MTIKNILIIILVLFCLIYYSSQAMKNSNTTTILNSTYTNTNSNTNTNTNTNTEEIQTPTTEEKQTPNTNTETPNTTTETPNTTQNNMLPQYTTTKLDSKVLQIMYCSPSSSTNTNTNTNVLLLTKDSLLRSEDGGITWIIMNDVLKDTAHSQIDTSINEIGKIQKIIISNENILYFLGSDRINWISKDCGENYQAFNHGRKIEELIFHPVDSNLILASAYTVEEDEVEGVYKELFISTNGGVNWDYMIDHVMQFNWGIVNYDNMKVLDIPKERVIVVRNVNVKNIDNKNKDTTNTDTIDKSQIKHSNLVYSDNYFRTHTIGLKEGYKFIVTNFAIFAAKYSSSSDMKEKVFNSVLVFADMKHYTYEFKNVIFNHPPELKQTDFDFLNISSTNYIVLNLQHKYSRKDTGDLYFSDDLDFTSISGNNSGINSRGSTSTASLDYRLSTIFNPSIKHNVKHELNGKVDFSELSGLKGVFIVNTIIDFTDLEEKEKNKLSEQYTGSSRKVQTQISFNRGVSWHKIPAPEKDSIGGINEECVESSNNNSCLLHLHGFSTNKNPFLSVDSAVGLVIANGNVGRYLNKDSLNTTNLYISKNGGFTWKEIRKGHHVFNIGDHGSIIVTAFADSLTNKISYSLNEGESWSEIEVSQENFIVRKIEIANNSMSMDFIVYGDTDLSQKSGNTGNTSNSANLNNSDLGKDLKVYIVGINFMSVFKYKCQNPQNAGTQKSDYELWTPHDNTIGHECFLGLNKTYVRRKSDRECYNGLYYERLEYSKKCLCKESDYLCDVGYAKSNMNAPCVKEFSLENGEKANEYSSSSECTPFRSKGYRKIPGNKCEAGVDLNPIPVNCKSDHEKLKTFWYFVFGLLGGALAIVYLKYSVFHSSRRLEYKNPREESNVNSSSNKETEMTGTRNRGNNNSSNSNNRNYNNQSINDNEDYEDEVDIKIIN